MSNNPTFSDELIETLKRLAITGCQSDEKELIAALNWAIDDLCIIRTIVKSYRQSAEAFHLMADRLETREYRDDRIGGDNE